MADPNFYETILNVPFDDAPGAITFADFSLRKQTMTLDFTGPTITSAFSKFAGHNSLNFTGAVNQSASLNNFTAQSNNTGQVEMHVRFASLTGKQGLLTLIGASGRQLIVNKNAANQIEVATASVALTAGGAAVTVGPFFHLAIVEDSTTIPATLRVYLEGTQIISFAVSGVAPFGNLNKCSIGPTDASSGTLGLNGQVCNLRILSGTFTYSGATITPPAAPFDRTALPINPSALAGATFLYAIPAGVMPAVKGAYTQVGIKVRDLQYGGTGKISGTVDIKGTPNQPVSRRVRLYGDRDGNLVSEQWSDAATGAYSFNNINAALTYTVITYDHLHNFRAVVADNLTPDPMP